MPKYELKENDIVVIKTKRGYFFEGAIEEVLSPVTGSVMTGNPESFYETFHVDEIVSYFKNYNDNPFYFLLTEAAAMINATMQYSKIEGKLKKEDIDKFNKVLWKQLQETMPEKYADQYDNLRQAVVSMFQIIFYIDMLNMEGKISQRYYSHIKSVEGRMIINLTFILPPKGVKK